jgi:hypothetical protein
MTYTTVVTYDDKEYVWETDHDYGMLYDLCELGLMEIGDEIGVEMDDYDLWGGVYSVPNEDEEE